MVVIRPENGIVVANAQRAVVGDTVTLDVLPNQGYKLESLTVMWGETPVEVKDNKFTMPAGAVTITAAFINHEHDWNYTADDENDVITKVCSCGSFDSVGTISLQVVDKTYDRAVANTAINKTGILVNEEGEITYWKGDEKLDTAPFEAGSYTAKLTLGGATINVPFTIKQAPLTITATAQTKTYGEADPELTYRVTGLNERDILTGKLSRTEGDHVGTYAITQGTLANPNYVITYVPENLTITAKPITITGATIADVTYDADGEYTLNVTDVTFENVVAGDTVGYTATAELTGDITFEDGATQTAATATVTVKLNDNSNYSLATKTLNTTVTITKHKHEWTFSASGNVITAACNNKQGCPQENKSVTLTLEKPANLTYDGNAKVVTVKQEPEVIFTDVPEVTYGNSGNTNAGDYTATLTYGGQTATLNFTIEPKSITGAEVGTFGSLTYTGNAQTPVADVIIDGLKATGSWSTVTNVSDETTTFTANGNFTGTLKDVELNPKMAKATPNMTAPIANTPTYNKEAQALVTAGSTTGGTMQYSLTENSGYSTDIPTGTNAGKYTVYYKVVGDNNYNDVEAKSVEVTIAKAKNEKVPSVTPKAETIKGKKDGSIIDLTTDMEYATTENGEYTAITGDKLENLAAGTYYVRYKETDNDEASKPAPVTINEGTAITVTFDANDRTFAEGFDVQLTDQRYGTKLTKPTDPTATDSNLAFVGWYKDSACKTEWNFKTDTLTEATVTLYAQWKKLKCDLTVHVTNCSAGEVEVEIVRDNKTVDTKTGNTGSFEFGSVDSGVYYVVVTNGDITKKELVTVDDTTVVSMELPEAGVKSELTVKDESNTPNIMVGGLDAVAAEVKTSNADAAEVLVTMDVEGQKESEVDTDVVTAIADEIKDEQGNQIDTVVEYLDIKLEQKVGNETIGTPITETTNVLEIVIPFQFSNRANFSIIRHHGNAAEAFTQITDMASKADKIVQHRQGQRMYPHLHHKVLHLRCFLHHHLHHHR